MDGADRTPVDIDGLTSPLEVKWGGVLGHLEFLVVPKLTTISRLIGMDLLSTMDIQINAKEKTTRPRGSPPGQPNQRNLPTQVLLTSDYTVACVVPAGHPSHSEHMI